MSLSALVVRCGSTAFGLPAESVREIAPLPTLARLPGAPRHVLGLINLRGSIFTVIDLGVAILEEETKATERTVVVVSAKERHLGLVVDDVDEVVELTDVAPLGSEGAVVVGTGHSGESIVLMVDVLALVRATLV